MGGSKAGRTPDGRAPRGSFSILLPWVSEGRAHGVALEQPPQRPRQHESRQQPPGQSVPDVLADDRALTATMLDQLLHHAHVVQMGGDSDAVNDKGGARRVSQQQRLTVYCC